MTLALEAFEGEWRVTRVITQAQGPDARFEGTARFVPDGAGLTCREEGELCLAGQVTVRAQRRYLWRAGPDGAIEVFFDDGRAFHRIAPGEAQPQDRHYCDPDVYDVTYDFSAWPDWTSRWQVRGPRKDYEMTSTYRRQGAPGG